MEGHDQRDQYGRQTQLPPRGYGQGYRNIVGSGVTERYGQAQTQAQIPAAQQQPTYGNPSPVTPQRPGSGGYGYTQQPQAQYGTQFHSTPLQYSTDFGTEANRQQQQYQTYMPNILYSLGQQQPSYDTMQTYQARPGNMGAPAGQYVSQYYSATGGYSGAGPSTPSHAPTSFQQNITYQTPAQQNTRRLSNPASYGSDISMYGQPSGFEMTSMRGATQAQLQPDQRRPNDGYREYLRKLRETYELIERGQLGLAGPALLEASEQLLTRVDELGLNRDEQSLQEQRRKMWKDFNTCWLAFMQKLKDSLEIVIQAGQPLPQPQSLVTAAYLINMAEKLIAWADSVEKFGLVDYEIGIWEEEILDIASDCRTLFETQSAQHQPP